MQETHTSNNDQQDGLPEQNTGNYAKERKLDVFDMVDVDASYQKRDMVPAVAATLGVAAGNSVLRTKQDEEYTSRIVHSNEDSESESESNAAMQKIDTAQQEDTTLPMGMSIGSNESKDIHRFKVIVMLVLLALAIVSSSCVVVFIKKAEQDRFENQFHDDALKVLESVRNSIDNTLMPMDNLAVALVSHAKARGDEWPFVTIEDFAVRIAKVLPLTDAIWITVLPVVTPDKRLQWENYSRTHDNWVVESLAVQDTWELYFGPKNITYNEEMQGWAEEIGGVDGPLDANTSRVMLPQWQGFPVIPIFGSAYNYDWLSVTMPGSPLECYSNHRSVLSEAYLIPEPDNPEEIKEAEVFIEYNKLFISPDDDPYEPVMDIFYPIIDDISRVKVVGSEDYDPKNNTLVGMLAATVYWRNIVRNALPTGSNGIIVVFNNTCTKSFTYQINGPDVVFVGIHDKHDTKYDHLRMTSMITVLENFSYTASVYSGAPISEEYCPYTLHLYPTDEMRSNFTTNNGAVYASVTFLVMLSLGLIFAMYDCKVERRQRKVLSSAIRSSEIVSSLFPTSVQDQLYPMQNENGEKRSITLWPAHTQDDVSETRPIVGGPIATLYPETTVMFADIKGFTRWSADRQPTEVFHLLETLYGAFDALAKTYGVFKVETIGDTYVAVVGLPNPCKQHAIVMARFAKKCIETMTDVTHKLESALGPGTTDLSVRVGLNSGPTTAGVLRGEKARFQLFGDTVNTASRMETNGESSRIHVSGSTAELIVQSGKEHWLTPRDSTIIVKGKGEMQTYWCDPIKTKQSTISGESINLPHTNENSVDWTNNPVFYDI